MSRETNKVQVFISYAREDKESALKMYKALKDAGLDPWLDKYKILPGQDWKIEIRKAIKNSRYFIPLFSSISVKKIGHVQNEFKFALDIFKTFPPGTIFTIPARLDNCEIPYEELSSIHHVDLFPNNDGVWKEAVDQILQAIALNKQEEPPKEEQTSSVLVNDYQNEKIDHEEHVNEEIESGREQTTSIPEKDNQNEKSEQKVHGDVKIKDDGRRKTIMLILIIVGVAGTAIVVATIMLSPPQPGGPHFTAYDNSAYGIKLNHPSDWLKNGTITAMKPVIFYPTERNSNKSHVAELRLGVRTLSFSSPPTLDEQLKNEINKYSLSSKFQIVESSTKTSLGGHPAYKLVFNYRSPSGVDRQAIDIGTFFGSKLYYIFSIVDADRGSDYRIVIQRMIDSFAFT